MVFAYENTLHSYDRNCDKEVNLYTQVKGSSEGAACLYSVEV